MYLESSGPDETFAVGEKIGRVLKAGDIVCLFGEIGAGKTTMIKGIASALGIDKRDITSASFTIIAEYETSPPFYHIDLYRVEGSEAVFDTGVYDYFRDDGIAVIEWAERLDPLPDGAIKIGIDIKQDDKRSIRIEGIDEKNRHNL